MGWFDLVDQVDVFVVLDDAQFSKQSWQQRNRIRTARGLEYLSIPVKSAGRMGQAIDEVALSDQGFVESFAGRIRTAYEGAPYLSTVEPEFSSVLRECAKSELLIDVNMGIIAWLCSALELEKEVVRASALGVSGKRGERVAALCEAVDAYRYVSPLGAKEYLTHDYRHFEARSISVELQGYVHPEYRQLHQPFIPYASTLDLLMMQGSQSMTTIRSGRRRSTSLAKAIVEGP
jgi:hypothetical protein